MSSTITAGAASIVAFAIGVLAGIPIGRLWREAGRGVDRAEDEAGPDDV